VLQGEEKKISGTNISRILRRRGRIPAVIYGFNKVSTISLSLKDFEKEHCKGDILYRLTNIKIGSEVIKVIVKEIQLDPVLDIPVHVDFQLVRDGIAVKVGVKIKVVNQSKSPGLKKGGVLNLVTKYLYLHCIPESIPKCLEVDIAGFDIGKNVHLNDIILPSKSSLVNKKNTTILTIAGRVEEKEEQKEKSDDNSVDTKAKKD